MPNVVPGQVWEMAFAATHPGIWMNHCQNLSLTDQGMMLRVCYDGVTTPFYRSHTTDGAPARPRVETMATDLPLTARSFGPVRRIPPRRLVAHVHNHSRAVIEAAMAGPQGPPWHPDHLDVPTSHSCRINSEESPCCEE
jgi:Multicopper oxidase